MAQVDNTDLGTDESVNEVQNPDEPTGDKRGVLVRTREGHQFHSNVEGVDVITSVGTFVSKGKVDAVVEASAPFGVEYLVVGGEEQG